MAAAAGAAALAAAALFPNSVATEVILGEIGAHNLLFQRTIFEDHERRHGANIVLFGKRRPLVDVNLAENHLIPEGLLQIFDMRRNRAARAAPGVTNRCAWTRIMRGIRVSSMRAWQQQHDARREMHPIRTKWRKNQQPRPRCSRSST